MKKLIGFGAVLLGPLAAVLRPLCPAFAEALALAPTSSCGCADYAAELDRWGPAECSVRREEIVGRLCEQAARRGLPAPPLAVRSLVRLAIRRAR